MKILTYGVSILLLLSSYGCQWQSSKVKVVKDLEYANYRHRGETKSLLLDIYLPSDNVSNSSELPLIIYIHGGGWREFSKEICPGKIVAQKGWAIACINYRYSTEAIFPAQIHDAKAAVRWLKANAKQYNLDPDRFAAWGASAGGHLSLLLGTSEGVASLEGDLGKGLALRDRGNLNYSSSVKAVCSFYAPTDFTLVKPAFTADISEQKNWQQYKKVPWYLYTVVTTLLLGGSVTKNIELARSANPITYIDSQDSPVMIIHGEKDKIVPVSQSDILVEALQKRDVPVTYIRKPEMTHTYKGKNGEKFDPELLTLVLDFMQEHIGD